MTIQQHSRDFYKGERHDPAAGGNAASLFLYEDRAARVTLLLTVRSHEEKNNGQVVQILNRTLLVQEKLILKGGALDEDS